MVRTKEVITFQQGNKINVGTKYTDAIGGYGPVAEIYTEKDWLHIVTDRYEGSVMLDVACLPELIKALQKINRNLQKTKEQ